MFDCLAYLPQVSLVVTESEIKILLRHALSLISSNEI